MRTHHHSHRRGVERQVRTATQKIVADVLQVARKLNAITDPLQAELWASVLLHTWHEASLRHATTDELEYLVTEHPLLLPRVSRDLAAALVPALEADRSEGAWATLIAIGALADGPVGATSREAAARLTRARGRLGTPAWAADVGRATPKRAFLGDDPSCDEEFVLIEYGYPSGARHSLLVATEGTPGEVVDVLLIPREADGAGRIALDQGRFVVAEAPAIVALTRARDALHLRESCDAVARLEEIDLRSGGFGDEHVYPIRALVRSRLTPVIPQFG